MCNIVLIAWLFTATNQENKTTYCKINNNLFNPNAPPFSSFYISLLDVKTHMNVANFHYPTYHHQISTTKFNIVIILKTMFIFCTHY